MSELINWLGDIGQDGYQRIYENCGIELDKSTSSGEWSVKCIIHEDKHASMSINKKSGLYKCHVSTCSAFDGGNVLSFLKLQKNIEIAEAIDYICKLLNILPPASDSNYKTKNKEIRIINDSIVEKYHQNLLESKKAKKALMEQRGFTLETLEKFRIGYEVKLERYTIPVYDENNKVINIRRYKMNVKVMKMLSYVDKEKNKYGTMRIFNIKNLLENREVIFTEGETDSILLEQYGFNSFTVTSGAGTFNTDWLPFFKNKIVHIAFDLDAVGKSGALKIAEVLYNVCEKVYIVTLPDTVGEHGDITDFFVSLKYKQEQFRTLLNVAKLWTPEAEEEEKIVSVTLGQASGAQYFGKKLKIPILISGKDTAPYLVPGKFILYCDKNAGKACAACPLAIEGGEKLIQLSAKDPEILELIDCSRDQQRDAIKKMSGNFKFCPRMHINIQKYINVEQIRMIPKISFSTEENEYVARTGYYIGHGIKTNRYYHILGYTFPEPKKEYATHIFSDIESAQDDIESFKLTDELKKKLKIFQQSPSESVSDKLYTIAKDFEDNITMIYGRKDMQIAMDLVYHSCLVFKFQNRLVKKGWLTGLVLGDSVAGETKVFVKIDGNYKYCNLIELEKLITVDTHLEVPSIDENAKVVWKTATLTPHPVNKDIYEVTLMGNKKIVITGDHSLFTRKATHANSCRKVKPIEVRKMNMKSPIAAISTLNDDIADNPLFDDDELIMFGYWVGNGSYGGKWAVAIAMGPYKDILSFLKRFTKKKKLNYRISKKVRNNRNFSIKSIDYVQKMKQLGFNSGKNFSKEIPSWVIETLSNKQIAMFLRGLFSADGSVSYRGFSKEKGHNMVVRLGSIYKDLLKRTELLLLRLGIESRVSEKGYISKNWSVHPCYNLSISGVDYFYKKIGFIQKDKNLKLKKLTALKRKTRKKDRPQLVFKNIKEIKKLGKQKRMMYDFTVPGTEKFITANGIICSNTGTGKSFMVTRLIEHYKLGDRICAEGATYAGLIGALSQVAGKWSLMWGKLPLSDRRLLVIDEMSGLRPEVIEKLTDCLSTGVASITKVITEETNARARILFLTNSKEGRPLNAYQGGIIALKSVIPKMEDIRRLDFAMTVAKDEVDSKIINTKHPANGITAYTSDLCHGLVLWCWSRKPDDIIISEKSQDAILETARYLSDKYSSQIPLVEAADQRFKIARMAVACAGRLYSTDDSGDKLVVTPEHVYFVRNFLDFIYSKDSMGYDVFSKAVRKKTEMSESSKEYLTEELLSLPHISQLRTFLMDNNFFKKYDMIDQIGYSNEEAKDVWRFLSKNYLITLHGKFGYTKEPNLIFILKELEKGDGTGRAIVTNGEADEE